MPCGPTAKDVALESGGGELRSKTIVITGGDTGLGFETARALSAAGARLIILSHNATKGMAAAKRLAMLPLRVILCDFSKLSSVRAAAAEILEETKEISVLMNNAGLLVGLKALANQTEDGFDRVVQVNFLGPLLLTELLMGSLRAARGRVIFVSSGASTVPCAWGFLAKNCTDLTGLSRASTLLRRTPPPGTNAMGFPTSNYGLTKYLQVVHAAYLARREAAFGSGVTAYSLEPGLVDTPMLRENVPAMEPRAVSVVVGARTQTWLASAAHLPRTSNGKFFSACEERPHALLKASESSADGLLVEDGFFRVASGWVGLRAELGAVVVHAPQVAPPLLSALMTVGVLLLVFALAIMAATWRRTRRRAQVL